ncbi:MAG TPA: antiactivator of flagellar biosynthesis FleN protein [Oxalicibacterium sp.]|nr:antiactivator of flagellar biosynthesis FleN protein [Oxalicibacterium sp.]
MASFECDQAEGLRRLLAGPKPRIFTFLSAATSAERSAMLVNLSTSLARTGKQVVLLDGCPSNGVSQRIDVRLQATLLDVARQQRAFDQVALQMPHGFHLAALTSGSLKPFTPDVDQLRRLSNTFNVLAAQADVLLVDAELDADDAFPIGAMASGEIVVQVGAGADSVKDAYALIKRLSAQSGRRPFGIVVSGTDEREAETVYQNMAQAASRYLAVQLYSVGFVPSDDHVTRAARQGRAVVDVFPRSGASAAFRRLAEQLSARLSHVAPVAEAGA